MPLNINGTEIESLNVDGTVMNELVIDGITVWESFNPTNYLSVAYSSTHDSYGFADQSVAGYNLGDLSPTSVQLGGDCLRIEVTSQGTCRTAIYGSPYDDFVLEFEDGSSVALVAGNRSFSNNILESKLKNNVGNTLPISLYPI